MGAKKWVCHISGQGEKWAVLNHSDARIADGEEVASEYEWIVRGKYDPKKWRDLWHSLPKSEYVLCEPPEVWVDVTGECQVDDYSNRSGDFWSIIHAPTGANVMSKCNDGYRLRKVTVYADNADHPQAAFIVERKQ